MKIKKILKWVKNLFQRDIWETEKTEFLRIEEQYDSTYFLKDTFHVYADHQISLTSNKKRVVERWEIGNISNL